jgi:DNA-binding NarL/FixJ family response regulator
MVVAPQTASSGPNGTQIAAEPITGREREVLALVAEGFSNKQIGADLGISERTVKNHLTATMSKLGAADRTHAVVTAVRLGFLYL